MASEKKSFGKKVKTLKTLIKTGKVLYRYAIPAALVVFATAAYAFLDVPIPEKRK